MAGNAGFGDDPLGPGCYSQLLFSDDGCFDFTSSIDNNTSRDSPKMLCFGDQKPVFTCMDSPTKSISKKRNGSDIQNAGYCAGNQRNCKKPKSENSTGGHAKVVKKEKLGERITALQQLVSPFGKTDTASVLHEALGYIRFLHDQVQVLSSPYLQRFGAPNNSEDGDCRKREKMKDDMRSRGLCLVPVDLTLHVAESNGADLWSSAAVMHT